MLSRTSNTYVKLPNELMPTSKTKDAKGTVTIKVVVPKSMEKKAEKFIDEWMDDFNKKFKKFVNKQADKLLSED